MTHPLHVDNLLTLKYPLKHTFAIQNSDTAPPPLWMVYIALSSVFPDVPSLSQGKLTEDRYPLLRDRGHHTMLLANGTISSPPKELFHSDKNKKGIQSLLITATSFYVYCHTFSFKLSCIISKLAGARSEVCILLLF